MNESTTRTILQEADQIFERTLQSATARAISLETGRVIYIGQGIARVSGLPGIQLGELIRFANGTLAMAFNLDEDEVGVVLLGRDTNIQAGSEVRRTGRLLDVPVGEELLGRVITPTGAPLDGRGGLLNLKRLPVEREAAPIMQRAPVNVPLQTGIKVVDALIPIGRGQRELILGDRQTGKTALALDTIINQRDQKMICIYCAIGQRNSAVAQFVADLERHDAMAYSVIVVAGADETPGLQFIAPYAATTIGEYFMEQGRDVLVIYDDLTRHAWAYREMSLLLRRPPGREAYPGDIFYVHSRLLERAARVSEEYVEKFTEGKVTNDTFDASSGKFTFFYDNALGLNLGFDTINGFGADDRIVTTRQIFDSDDNATIGFGSNNVLDLSGEGGPKSSDGFRHPGGQIDLNGVGHNMLSIDFLGQETVNGVTYYHYGIDG